MFSEEPLFLAALRRRISEAVARHMQAVAFTAGQVIFLRDDEPRDLFVIRKGRVRLSILSSEGRELSLAHATEGDVFGEIGLLDGGPRTANATALTEVKALSLGRSTLLNSDGNTTEHRDSLHCIFVQYAADHRHEDGGDRIVLHRSSSCPFSAFSGPTSGTGVKSKGVPTST